MIIKPPIIAPQKDSGLSPQKRLPFDEASSQKSQPNQSRDANLTFEGYYHESSSEGGRASQSYTFHASLHEIHQPLGQLIDKYI